MSYLLDTNVLSELRKRKRCNPGVAEWFAGVEDSEIFLSVLVVGEVRKGIEMIRRRDSDAAAALESWLGHLLGTFAERILAIDQEIAQAWGRLSVPDPLPVIDGLLAATAQVRGLTLVTHNLRDVERTGAAVLNPFS